MNKPLTSAPGLAIKAAPTPLFPDHPNACFVLHTPPNRRVPATWASPEAAQEFVDAVRNMVDWTSTDVTLTKAIVQAVDDHDGTWDDCDTPWLPAPPYVPTPAETADLLDKALGVLATNGWCQGDASTFHDLDQEHDEDLEPGQCRACARGAINVAAEGDPRPPTAYKPGVLADTATAALAETLGVDDATVWNDAEGRTSDEVHTAFTRTIDRLRDAQATT
ncbi:hypothetical protein PV516_19065 [Streptomyces scabiei]|uniref:DUF6197 family protein n=1 Tax=Streptomyces scabiei TaxID=1930 RepID=UPI0029A93716|nr:hypothetical protein [Streptomyces scabiei]MDX3165889.1 hypothetical protein [Streptomyces scabiei]